MPIALLFILLLSGGTSYIAKDSVPGDILYPVKININENVESLLAMSDKQDAIVDVKQASRRLEEAQSLSEKGKLTSEKSEKIRKSFENKVNDMNVRLRGLTGKGDTQFISELNDKLEVEIDDHFDVFGKVTINATGTPLFSDLFRRIEDRHRRSEGKNLEKATSTESKMEDGQDDEDDNRNTLNTLRIRDEDDDDGDDDDEIRVNTTTVATPPGTVNVNNTLSTYTMAQVSLHNKSSDCYSVVNGGVYNLTSWISQHPGGASAIISLCGIDGTNAFIAQHNSQGKPEAELASFKIGIIK